MEIADLTIPIEQKDFLYLIEKNIGTPLSIFSQGFEIEEFHDYYGVLIEEDKLVGLSICRGSNIKILPPTINILHDLITLDLSFNLLQFLPETIGQLQNLKQLRLYNNPLKSLPNTIGQLKNLELIIIRHCELKSLPDSFCQLENLKYLNLMWNRLESLPKNFGKLRSLEYFDIKVNKLKRLPKSFFNLKSLKTLILDNNLFEKPPYDLWKIKMEELSIFNNPFINENKKLETYSTKQLTTFFWQKTPINIFFIGLDDFFINEITAFLRKSGSIKRVFENIDKNESEDLTKENLRNCQLCVFIADKKSIKSNRCKKLIDMVINLGIFIIPIIKIDEIQWEDLIPLSLHRELGFEYQLSKKTTLLKDLLEYINDFKKEVNLFSQTDLESRKIEKIYFDLTKNLYNFIENRELDNYIIDNYKKLVKKSNKKLKFFPFSLQ